MSIINSNKVNGNFGQSGISSGGQSGSDVSLKESNNQKYNELSNSLLSKIRSGNDTASAARENAVNFKNQAVDARQRAEDAQSPDVMKDLIRLAKQFIQEAKEQIKIMLGAQNSSEEAKNQLAQNPNKVQGAGNTSSSGTDFLYNQRPDNQISNVV